MIVDCASTSTPTSAMVFPPEGSHGHTTWTGCATPSRPTRMPRRHTESRTTRPASRAGAADRRSPAPGTTARAAARRRGRAFRSWPSSLEQIEVIRHDGPADTEQKNDDGEAERRFGDGDADREDGEDHPRRDTRVAGERDQVDVDGVHHQLDA